MLVFSKILDNILLFILQGNSYINAVMLTSIDVKFQSSFVCLSPWKIQNIWQLFHECALEKRPGHGDGVDEARSTTFKAIIHSRPQSLSILVTWSWNEGLVGYKLSRVALGTRMAIIISHSWQNQADWFFLGRDFAHMVRTTWKRSKPCIFVLEQSRQIQTLQLKQQKKKCEYCHSS